MTIDQYIKGMAEEYWKDEVKRLTSVGIKVHPDSGQRDINGFSAGASAMIPIMEGFSEWLVENYYRSYDDKLGFHYLSVIGDNYYTTKQLLELYFETLK